MHLEKTLEMESIGIYLDMDSIDKSQKGSFFLNQFLLIFLKIYRLIPND
jgi:hypothetical protein